MRWGIVRWCDRMWCTVECCDCNEIWVWWWGTEMWNGCGTVVCIIEDEDALTIRGGGSEVSIWGVALESAWKRRKMIWRSLWVGRGCQFCSVTLQAKGGGGWWWGLVTCSLHQELYPTHPSKLRLSKHKRTHTKGYYSSPAKNYLTPSQPQVRPQQDSNHNKIKVKSTTQGDTTLCNALTQRSFIWLVEGSCTHTQNWAFERHKVNKNVKMDW